MSRARVTTKTKVIYCTSDDRESVNKEWVIKEQVRLNLKAIKIPHVSGKDNEDYAFRAWAGSLATHPYFDTIMEAIEEARSVYQVSERK